jgi:hypothetical protein
VPGEQLLLSVAYLQWRREQQAAAAKTPPVGRGEAAFTPLHAARAKAADSQLTDRIRAARAAKQTSRG